MFDISSAAAVAVLEVIEAEKLIEGVEELSRFATARIKNLPGVKRVKGRGLMLGLEFDFGVSEIRKRLIYEKKIFTGGSSNPNVLRILPPLNVSKDELAHFAEALSDVLASEQKKGNF